MEVRHGKDDLPSLLPLKEETDLRDKDLFPDFTEEIFHTLGTVRHMRNERVDECEATDLEGLPERLFNHPDQGCKAKPENNMEDNRDKSKKRREEEDTDQNTRAALR